MKVMYLPALMVKNLQFCWKIPRQKNAASVAETIIKAVDNTHFSFEHNEIAVTVSIGIAEITAEDESISGLISRADKALYHAKENGCNQHFIDENH